MEKPFSQACENNKQPIFKVIAPIFSGHQSVLEVGSGTGQHAVFFASQLPQLRWQCSDQAEYLPGVRAWIEDTDLSNVEMPLELDVMKAWPLTSVPAIFSANTVHIMHWPQVEAFFEGIKQHLQADGDLCLYGPFNYEGAYTSDSNAQFDQWLKQRDPGMGIRDIEAITALAETAGLQLLKDYTMPANNRLLHFRKQP